MSASNCTAWAGLLGVETAAALEESRMKLNLRERASGPAIGAGFEP